ncbi:MAG: hypothetical protein AAFV80_11130, partial [Bacteroidota bacterium]
MSTRLQPAPLPDLLFKVLRWERNRNAFLASLCILLSIFCLLYLGKVNKSLGILLALTALTLIVVAFRFLLSLVLHWRVANHPLVRLLKE